MDPGSGIGDPGNSPYAEAELPAFAKATAGRRSAQREGWQVRLEVHVSKRRFISPGAIVIAFAVLALAPRVALGQAIYTRDAPLDRAAKSWQVDKGLHATVDHQHQHEQGAERGRDLGARLPRRGARPGARPRRGLQALVGGCSAEITLSGIRDWGLGIGDWGLAQVRHGNGDTARTSKKSAHEMAKSALHSAFHSRWVGMGISS